MQPCIEVVFAPFSKNVKTAVSIGDFHVKKAICTGDFYGMRAMFPEKLHGWAKIIRPFVEFVFFDENGKLFICKCLLFRAYSKRRAAWPRLFRG